MTTASNANEGAAAATAPEPSEELKGAVLLAQALALKPSFSQRGTRDRYRALLLSALQKAREKVSSALSSGDEARAARWTLIQVLVELAEDARYGAGQLAQGAQRAPTEDDCEDGWRRVEEIVQFSEACAAEAADIVRELDSNRAQHLALRASRSALLARKVVDERNHAYTFHTDPAFSFGEGWYIAAAGILWGVKIQVEPEQPQTPAARVFLEQAGLGERCVPYRARPRANKALPDLIARAFRADPRSAQARLRAAFLGGEVPSRSIVGFAETRLGVLARERSVLVWIRKGRHHAGRNSEYAEVAELCRIAASAGLSPILIGDALDGGELPAGAGDLTLFWKQPLFQSSEMRRSQLLLMEHLRSQFGLVGQAGVTTAGMDGPALLGLPTLYITDKPNDRLGRWVGAVPGYEEVVRTDGYLDSLSRRFEEWAR